MGSSVPTKWEEDYETPGPELGRERVQQLIDELAEGEPGARLLRSKATKSRLEDLGNVSCILAHELRQPLFTIAVANENLRLMLEGSGFTNEQMLKSVARVTEQVDRAQALIGRILDYVQTPEIRRESGDLGEAANNAVRFFGDVLQEARIEIEVSGTHGLAKVGIVQIEMEQVFVNLLSNAAESIEERRKSGWQGKGRIAVVAEQCDGQIRCVVADNGAGLAQDVSESAFQPFFTTKASNGTGLGLHICRQIMAKGDGRIRLLPGREEGARVEIRIPLLKSLR